MEWCRETNKPELLAPGARVLGACGMSEHGHGRWRMDDGTSISSAIVSGVAALCVQRDPSLIGNPTALRQEILNLTRARGGNQLIDLQQF